MRTVFCLLAAALCVCSCGPVRGSKGLDSLARETVRSMGEPENLAVLPKLSQSLYAVGPTGIHAIQEALADPAYTAKPALMAVLSSYPDDRVPPMLIQLLGKIDPSAQRQALQGIAMQPRYATAAGIYPAAVSIDPNLREWGLYALGRQGFPVARELAIKASKEGSIYLRRQAARALRTSPDGAALQVLHQLAHDPDAEVSLEAQISLARLTPSDPGVVAKVANLASGADKWSPRDKIEEARVFGEMGPLAEPLLAKLLADPDPRVRAEAAGAYARLGRVKNPQPLTRALESDPDMKVRVKAAAAISRLDLPEAVPALKKLLLSQNRALMLLAAETSIRMRNAQAVGPFFLMAGLRDKEMQRYGAIGKMNQGLGDGKFFQLVDGIYGDADSLDAATREAAAGLLSVIPGPKAEGVLKKLCFDADEKVRLAAMRGLKGTRHMPIGVPPIRVHPLASWDDFPR